MQKDKVWSCSEYDEEIAELSNLEAVRDPKEKKQRKLELV